VTRILFCSTGGDGHLLPLLPLAEAFAARGDDVVVAAPENHRERIGHLRLRFEQVGPTLAELKPSLDAHRATMERLPFADRRPAAFTGRFAEIEAPQRVEGLRAVVEAWRPELVVHEPADLAAPIAAAAAGVATVNHAFGRPIPDAALRRAAAAIAPLWLAAGVEPDAFAGAYRGAYVDVCPPSLRADLPRTPARTYPLRPAEADDDGATRSRPRIYSTLGTVFNDVGTFRLLLDAFDGAECDVVMTIGRNLSPDELEPIPPNVTVAQYIPQAEILRSCEAVVAHAGSGSVLASLAHGRPLVLLPRGADQFENATVCSEIGVAVTIQPTDLSADRVRDALQQVLTDAAFAGAARSVAAEIVAMPPAASVAENLATQR
jgi:UDP:flavonoid glycosyltransferase YjiC (YdhE family)